MPLSTTPTAAPSGERAPAGAPAPAAPGETVVAAGKLRHPELPDSLRVLVPAGGGAPVLLHKNPIDWGAQAQLFAGVQGGRPVVLRRLNALDAHTVGGCRDQLREFRRRKEAARPAAAGTSPRAGDTLTAAKIWRDIRLTARVAAARGQPFGALATGRGPAAGISKVFELLEPRQADLLGVVVALAGQPLAVRAAVAGICIGSLAADLTAFSALGVVHGDLREENILFRCRPGGETAIEACDFGLAADGPLGAGVPRQEMRAVARLALVLLHPGERPGVTGAGADLEAAIERVRPLTPGWAALLDDMTAGALTSGRQLAGRLAAMGSDAPAARRRAQAVLAGVREKEMEIRDNLACIAAWVAGEATTLGADPWRDWPPALWARAAARVGELAEGGEISTPPAL